MIVRLDTHRLQTLDQVREFLDGSEQVRPATTNPRRRLRVRGENRATVRLRPAGKADKGHCQVEAASGRVRR